MNNKKKEKDNGNRSRGKENRMIDEVNRRVS